ncbi:dienelactone hydrolase family protein [Pararhodobacter sp.]|uniref:dienelactone hydrolase family protein n=1 Tax=Pararhodobacter sp. TaxID=2127056 RepID=UPI002FE190CA
MRFAAFVTAFIPFLAGAAQAEITGTPLPYRSGDLGFEGYVARNDAVPSRGIVLIVHDWDGLTAYERTRAQMLAAEGYTAVALDLYGTAEDPQGMEDYRRLSGALLGDREELRARLQAAMAAAESLPGAEAGRVLIGYCFGGSAALEAARAGAETQGFVIFHGGLATPEGQDYTAVTAPVQLFHGSADPASGPEDLAAALIGLSAAGVAHGAHIYGNVRHAFTVWGGRDYDAGADARSWQGLLDFLSESL